MSNENLALKVPSEIDTLMGDIMNQLNIISSDGEIIENRLGIILKSPPPENPNKAESPQLNTELGRRLYDMYSKVKTISYNLERLKNRIEL